MNIDKPKLQWQLTFEGAWPTAVAFLGSGRRIAAANQDGQIYVWNLPESPPAFEPAKGSDRQAPDHAPVRRLDGHTNGVTRLVATTDGKQLVSASLDHTLRLWLPEEPATGTADAVLDIEQRQKIAKREKKNELLTAPGVTVETLSAAHVLEGHADWVSLARHERRPAAADQRRRAVAGDCLGSGRSQGSEPLVGPAPQLDSIGRPVARRSDRRGQRIPLQTGRFRHAPPRPCECTTPRTAR